MSINRITGISSGIDTDSIIKDLMKLEKAKIDNIERDKISAEWKQESYRESINSIKAFQSEYFDLLKSETNFRSVSAFSEFTESVQVNGEDVSYVSVTGTASIKNYSHTIDSITRLASKDEWTTDAIGVGNLKSGNLNFGLIPSSVEMSLTIDGNTKTIAISDTTGITDKNTFVAAIDAEIQAKFGSDYAGVVQADATDQAIYFRLNGSEITVLATTGNEADLNWMGVDSGASTSDYEDSSLFNLMGITNDDLSGMSINGVMLSDLGITQGSTMSELTDIISASTDINATLTYNTTNDRLELSSNKTGSANEIEMNGLFMSKFGFVDDLTHHTEGQNAEIVLDGTTIVKSSNTFTIDGLQYTLNDVYTDPESIDIEVNTDTSAIVEKVKSFVETYNGLIQSIKAKIEEKRDYDYEPLTSEEKEALSDDEIERWEEKTKKGLLRGDSTLEKMLTDMRTALYESVSGVGLSLSDIGIETTKNYKEGGKLIIDEDKLIEALENNFDSVVQLFTNESDKEYLDSDNISERYSENGIAYRLYDIMQNNIRITRDSSGTKGTLLEKAGIEGDVTDANNILTEQILDYETRIADLWEDYYDQEDFYYRMFGNMESALAEMQSQGNSLLSQLG